MPLSSLVRDLNLDRYDRNARLQPALLVLLPAFLLVGTWYPASRSGSGWIASLLVACGATFLLAQVTRRRGRALEQGWGDRVGRRHSARLLSSADRTLSAAQKKRIADWIARHGPGLPSVDEERRDPRSAEDRRLAAVAWMLEATRGDAATSMLLAENVSYGFWRNMRGLRPIGIAVTLLVMDGKHHPAVAVGIQDGRFGGGCGRRRGGGRAGRLDLAGEPSIGGGWHRSPMPNGCSRRSTIRRRAAPAARTRRHIGGVVSIQIKRLG
jgi:hypothetical protein